MIACRRETTAPAAETCALSCMSHLPSPVAPSGCHINGNRFPPCLAVCAGEALRETAKRPGFCLFFGHQEGGTKV